MPTNIPSVDLTRSQGNNHGDLRCRETARIPLTYHTQRRGEHMQLVKTYTSGLLKGEARYQFLRDLKKMAKDGWHVHTLTDEGVGRGQAHTGRYKVVFEK
jgi:hypothetical protein